MPAESNHADAPAPGVCPACTGRLYPRELACVDCGLRVSTRYADNEFQNLDADSLHLLRVFIACEGRIRDMERALGVSYPTVKSRLAGAAHERRPQRCAGASGRSLPCGRQRCSTDWRRARSIFDAAMRELKR